MGIGALSDLLGGGGASDKSVPPATQRVIEIDGTELADEIDALVESVIVVDRLRMPDSFVLVIRDYKHSILEKAGIEIAAKVRISTTEVGGEDPKPLFYGEVTSIEAEYDVLGMRAVVRGYDLLHRLAAGRRTKVYKNVTYADVAEEIADAAGLDTDVDGSGGTLDHVIQANVSDLDFLYQLASRVGFDVGVEEDVLVFKEPSDASGAPDAGDTRNPKPTQLVWSRNLLEFRARMSAVAQVTKVNVRGWDVSAKEPVIGEAEAETTSTTISMTPVELAEAVGGEALVVVDRPVDEQGAADDLAKAVAEQVASSAFEATAVAVGSPELKAGQAVSITEVDPALAGKWVITTARHEFGSSGPYRTHLEFSGRQDRSLHGLVAGGLAAPAARTSIPGVVIGIVSDNDDPEELGRVKVKYPWLADDAESWWARLATIGAGKRRDGRGHGITWIPEVGEEVVVAFEQGDVAHPIVVGSLWNGVDTPPGGFMDGLFDAGAVKKTAIISRKGHGLIFHDNDDTSGIVLGTANGPTIGLDDVEKTITITADGKQIQIESTGDLKLKAGKGLTIEADGPIDIKAGANMTIKGARVAIN
jgi:phage protein D